MYLCWSVGFWIMVFSPSMTCCFSWWDSIPLKHRGKLINEQERSTTSMKTLTLPSSCYNTKPKEIQTKKSRESRHCNVNPTTRGFPRCLPCDTAHREAQTFNQPLTFDWRAFEWLSNLVPGFCYLSVLRGEKEKKSLVLNGKTVLH